MSRKKATVETYLDGFRKNDHAQILSCLTDDIEWTVFGGFHLTGKEAYDAAIEGPGFIPPPELEVVRMVEEGDVVMAELTGSVKRDTETRCACRWPRYSACVTERSASAARG